MWGLALAHVTVTQNGSSCCQGIERRKEERQTTEAEFKEGKKNRRNSIENRNKSISVNHPSPAICLHLDTTQRTREDNNNWIQFFINTFQFLNRSTELFFSLYLARLYPRRKQKMTKKGKKKKTREAKKRREEDVAESSTWWKHLFIVAQ